MGQVTRFSGDYNITGLDTTSNLAISVHTMTVNGNLLVSGNVTEVTSTNTNVKDNIITLNKGEVGAGVTQTYAGIAVDRGSLSTTSIRWNEITQKWEITNDGVTYGNIAIATASGAPFEVIQDTSPQLGGNLDVLARTIFSSNTEHVTFSLSGANYPGGSAGSGIAIENTAIVPSYKMNHNVIYTQSPAGGGSGIFVTNETVQQEELATKTKAIIYALIM